MVAVNAIAFGQKESRSFDGGGSRKNAPCPVFTATMPTVPSEAAAQ